MGPRFRGHRSQITVDRYRCVLKMLCRILTDLGWKYGLRRGEIANLGKK